MNKGEIINLEIIDLGVDGSGIGKADGLVVFVPGAVPGDVVNTEITDMGRFAKGRLISIIKESQDRRVSNCPYSDRCGGCQLREYKYEAQLRWKEKHVRDCLERIAGIEEPVMRPIVPSAEDNYRNKAEMHIDGEKIGFKVQKSSEIVPVEACRIQNPLACEIAAEFRANPVKNAEQLIVRSSNDGNAMAYTIQKSGYVLLYKGQRVLKDYIDTDLGRLKIEVDPYSFYQVNPVQCGKLYSIAQKYALGDKGAADTVLDLYCGAGSIGLSMAGRARRVIGVESVKPAVIAANRNAVINGIVNAEFVSGKAEEVVSTKLQGIRADVVILDPPRAGCKKELLETVASISPERLVYVSCNPSTLARDIKILTDLGFTFVEATPVDMFPNTVHVETVVLMSRVKE